MQLYILPRGIFSQTPQTPCPEDNSGHPALCPETRELCLMTPCPLYALPNCSAGLPSPPAKHCGIICSVTAAPTLFQATISSSSDLQRHTHPIPLPTPAQLLFLLMLLLSLQSLPHKAVTGVKETKLSHVPSHFSGSPTAEMASEALLTGSASHPWDH